MSNKPTRENTIIKHLTADDRLEEWDAWLATIPHDFQEWIERNNIQHNSVLHLYEPDEEHYIAFSTKHRSHITRYATVLTSFGIRSEDIDWLVGYDDPEVLTVEQYKTAAPKLGYL